MIRIHTKFAISFMCVSAIICIAATANPDHAPPIAPVAQPSDLFKFYATNLRGSLFAGFLTLGSFLVAVNTFVIVNLKKEVYDHDGYFERVVNTRKGTSKPSFYGPLSRLSALILGTIICAVVTAAMQLTIGIIFQNSIGAIVCMVAAAITMLLLFASLCNIGLNLKDWFKFWEEQACKKETTFNNEKSAKIDAEQKKKAQEEAAKGAPTVT